MFISLQLTQNTLVVTQTDENKLLFIYQHYHLSTYIDLVIRPKAPQTNPKQPKYHHLHHIMKQDSLINQSHGQSLSKSKDSSKHSREVNAHETEEYLRRPPSKVSNLNRDLSKVYIKEKHLSNPKFDYLRQLRNYRKNKQQDSISEHGGTDDEDFVVDQAQKIKGKGRKRVASDHFDIEEPKRQSTHKTTIKEVEEVKVAPQSTSQVERIPETIKLSPRIVDNPLSDSHSETQSKKSNSVQSSSSSSSSQDVKSSVQRASEKEEQSLKQASGEQDQNSPLLKQKDSQSSQKLDIHPQLEQRKVLEEPPYQAVQSNQNLEQKVKDTSVRQIKSEKGISLKEEEVRGKIIPQIKEVQSQLESKSHHSAEGKVSQKSEKSKVSSKGSPNFIERVGMLSKIKEDKIVKLSTFKNRRKKGKKMAPLRKYIKSKPIKKPSLVNKQKQVKTQKKGVARKERVQKTVKKQTRVKIDGEKIEGKRTRMSSRRKEDKRDVEQSKKDVLKQQPAILGLAVPPVVVSKKRDKKMIVKNESEVNKNVPRERPRRGRKQKPVELIWAGLEGKREQLIQQQEKAEQIANTELKIDQGQHFIGNYVKENKKNIVLIEPPKEVNEELLPMPKQRETQKREQQPLLSSQSLQMLKSMQDRNKKLKIQNRVIVESILYFGNKKEPTFKVIKSHKPRTKVVVVSSEDEESVEYVYRRRPRPLKNSVKRYKKVIVQDSDAQLQDPYYQHPRSQRVVFGNEDSAWRDSKRSADYVVKKIIVKEEQQSAENMQNRQRIYKEVELDIKQD